MFFWAKNPNLNNDYNTDELKNELMLIKKYFEHYDELSINERIELINHFMDIQYDTRDILLITNSITRADHDMIMELPTKMEDVLIVGYNYQSHPVYNEINYLVTTREDLNLKNKRYSFTELMSMYYTREICPIYKFTKELKKFSDDREPVKMINTLEDYGIDVSPYPEFEQFDIKFDKRALEYQELIFDNSNINKNASDLRVLVYLDRLIDLAKNNERYKCEKNTIKQLNRIKKSKVK